MNTYTAENREDDRAEGQDLPPDGTKYDHTSVACIEVSEGTVSMPYTRHTHIVYIGMVELKVNQEFRSEQAEYSQKDGQDE